jgi:heme O synthase-like polyprenyltransferase
MLVDRDRRQWTGIGGALILAGLAYLFAANGPMMLGIVVLTFIIVVGLATLALRWTDERVAGFIGASLPVIGWLVITGVCYSPLFGS